MHDVAIVGYGPVGATLAGLLGRLGLRVAVFERAWEIYPKPRAVGFDHDAMRLFQRLGVAHGLAEHIAPFREGIYVGADDRIIQHVKHLPPPYPLTWPPHFTCDQPGVEKILRSANAEMPQIDVSLGCQYQNHEQDADGVWVHLTDAQGKSMSCRARYLVGCDGASSPMRQQMKVSLESFDYDERWIVVDMKVSADALARLPQTNVQYCKPERPCTFVNCPGNHRRWEFMTLPDDLQDGTAVTDEKLWSLMAPWIAPHEAEIWRSASYRFHALVADDWQDGRVFLAGDSAHQTPPFLGQGMCQGLRDAGNLAWKLHHVITGQASDALLRTYTAERRPNVVETTRLAKEFGKIISERDPVKARLRDERIFSENNGGARTVVRQDLIPPLQAGMIATHTPLAGRVFPQPMIEIFGRDPIWMDDLAGPRFRLVVCVGQWALADLQPVVEAAGAAGVQVTLLTDQESFRPLWPSHVSVVSERGALIKNEFDQVGVMAALVRPDHYVYAGLKDVASVLACLKDLDGQFDLQM